MIIHFIVYSQLLFWELDVIHDFAINTQVYSITTAADITILTEKVMLKEERGNIS